MAIPRKKRTAPVTPNLPVQHVEITDGQPEPMEKRPELPQKVRLKILGVGGAGGNTVSHIATVRAAGHHALAGVELIAVNTDLQALQGVAGVEAIQIGADVTHGLGAGGDVELGARAAQQDSERLTAAMQHADVVFITAGLGGGTGGGASPVVARLAKEQGALVLAFVAMPFGFEGERRQHQALTSLEQLKAQADAVICIPNNKLFKLLGDNASVMDAFRRSDGIVVSGAQAIWQLLSRKGLINLDFAALRATLGSKHCEGLFSHGEGQGQDKAREAVKNLLENPIFDGGDAMARAEGLLVSILGGPDLTLADVQRAVEPLSRTANRAHLIMGAAVDEGFRGRMAITVIVATNIVSKRGLPATLAKTTLPRRAVETFPSRGGLVAAGRAGRATTASTAGSASKQDAVEHRKGSAKAKQETFQLDGISRGRFDKSEPTLYDGEDLDVPTFIRRGVSLKR
jgi:cell division protein FtsZ